MTNETQPEILTATLLVSGWETRCSNCNKSTSYETLFHETNLGWGDENGTPGCGALFTAIAGMRTDITRERLAELRPDLEYVEAHFR